MAHLCNRLLLVVLACAAQARAQTWIELTDVPPRIHGHLDQGRNLLITAAIRGAVVDEVWLAVVRKEQAPGDGNEARVALTRVGERNWQINVASRAARKLLGGQGSGEVAVFASSRGAAQESKVCSSVPVQFEVRPSIGSARLVDAFNAEIESVWRPQLGLTKVTRTKEGGRISVQKFKTVDPRRPIWVDASTTSEIVVGVEEKVANDRSEVGHCEIGERTWSLERKGAHGVSLVVTDELRAAWTNARILTLLLPQSRKLELRPAPRSFPTGQAHEFTVGQRRYFDLPTSDPKAAGWLTLTLGDITDGQVGIEVRTALESLVLESTSMREGGIANFQHLGASYTLTLVDLHNAVIGRDHAKFRFERLDNSGSDPR